MIGRTELRFSAAQVDRAETRLNHQRSVVDKLRWGDDPKFATLAEDTLDLMERRAALLQKSHRNLVASFSTGRDGKGIAALLSTARQQVDNQTELVLSMPVGDARKPEARGVLDQTHRTEEDAATKLEEASWKTS